MAPVLGPPRSSQAALLDLEKGANVSASQLNEAAQIIGIDMRVHEAEIQAVGISPKPQATTASAPKEEWVLRWLLKKLKTPKGPLNYKLDSDSWLLLRLLQDRIPPKTLAAILNEAKFLEILEDALADLDRFAAGSGGIVSVRGTSGSKEKQLELASGKRGKKRKRVDGETGNSDSSDQQEPAPSSWASTLLYLLGSIQGLVALSNQSHGIDGTSRSHLKLALRGDPQVAANILGRSFRIATLALPVLANDSRSKTERGLLSVLPSVFEIWELRSSYQNDSTKTPSNGALCPSYLLPALQLLSCLRKSSSILSERDIVIQPVERLVALHVILPARSEFFSITSTDQKNDTKLILTISSNVSKSFGSEEPQTEDNKVAKLPLPTAELLPTLLDVAIRSVPRDTFRRQNNEAPWLEALFIALSELAGYSLDADIPQKHSTLSYKTLVKLYDVIIERKISISLKTLSAFASRFSGLDDDANQAEWNLISKLIKVGVDVFLPNSGLDDSEPLLNALLSRIRGLSIEESVTPQEIYATIKSGIIIPLLHGFVGARDINTFTKIWLEQLIAIESTAKIGGNQALFSVWEDDDLAAAYSSSASKSLSDNQNIAQAQAMLKEVGKMDASPESFAHTVILDSLTASDMRIDGTAEIKDTYQSILKILTSAIIANQKPRWQWRMWRLARNVIDKRLRWVDTSFVDLEAPLIEEAAKTFQGLRKGLKSGLAAGDYLEALEAFRFAIFALERTDDSRYANQIGTVVSQVVSFFKRVGKEPLSSWEGGIQTLDSPGKLAIGYLMTLLSKPEAVVRLSSEQRSSLFSELISLAASTPETNAERLSNQFREIWDGFVSYGWLLNAQPAAYDIVEVLSARIKKDTKVSPLMISSLVNVPARLIPRHQRGKILDLLQGVLMNGSTLRAETYTEIFAFMAALINLPKSTAQITNDPEILWNLADSITLPGTDMDQLICRSFQTLHQAVLDGFLVASDEQCQKYFKLSFKKSSKIANKLDSTIDYASMAFFMARTSLSAQWLHREKAQASFKEDDVSAVREKIFDLLLQDLKSSRKLFKKGDENIASRKLHGILYALEDFEDLAQSNKEVHKTLRKTEEEIVEAKELHGDVSLQKLIKRRVISTQRSGKSIVRPLMQCSTVLPVQQLDGEEQRAFFGEARQRLSSMSMDGIVKFIQEVREAGFLGEHASYNLLLVGMAVICCEVIEDRDSAASSELTSLFTDVTESMHQSQSVEQFSLATECLDVLLRTQSRSISQWNIDNVLGGVLISVSGSGPKISPENAGVVYTRLCRLMGSLIGLYRRKLGGRFHLVLPVTQALLRCIFTSDSKQRKSTKAQPDQPPWLSSSKSGLTTDHGVQYTRLLTSLCDPTTSAVHTQRGPGGHDLTDPTKKAKRVAGQHLQYLVMEYAQCQLRNSLTPEMKAALMPGLYSVLDVMSRETMRTMNAAMDSSSRAVFKGLYDDYTRFGKWNKN